MCSGSKAVWRLARSPMNIFLALAAFPMRHAHVAADVMLAFRGAFHTPARLGGGGGWFC